MSFSLPDSKIQSISLSAQTLLNQPKVSLSKLSQFIGMCNASRTTVLEAPLHYRSMQNQLTSTVRSQPITHQNYDVKVCLNSQSRKDLTWWVKKFEYKLFKTNPPSTSGSFSYVRCLRSSLGSSPRICKNSGIWRSHQFSWYINRKELKAAFLLLKF